MFGPEILLGGRLATIGTSEVSRRFRATQRVVSDFFKSFFSFVSITLTMLRHHSSAETTDSAAAVSCGGPIGIGSSGC